MPARQTRGRGERDSGRRVQISQKVTEERGKARSGKRRRLLQHFAVLTSCKRIKQRMAMPLYFSTREQHNTPLLSPSLFSLFVEVEVCLFS
jgi:hypothetical protein